MKKFLILFFVTSSLLLSSCSSSKKADDGYPAWVKNLISTYEKENAHAQILQYSYHEKTVYFVSFCYQCPDAMEIVYDKDNNKLCEFGGFAGLNTCPDFSEKATDKKIIWQNKNFQY